MKIASRNASILAALSACLLVSSACQSSTVNGPNDTSLTQTTAQSITIHRGGSAALGVVIDRHNFSGPVTVSIAKLPSGVDADDSSMSVETDKAVFILKASKSADLVTNQAVEVTVKDPGGRKTTQIVNLTVKS